MNISNFNRRLLSPSLLVSALVIGSSAVHSSDTESTSEIRARASALMKEKIEQLNQVRVTENLRDTTYAPVSYFPERDALKLGAFMSLFEGKPINPQAVQNLGEEIQFVSKKVAQALDATKDITSEIKNEQFYLFYLIFAYNLFTGQEQTSTPAQSRTRFDEQIAAEIKCKANVQGLLEQLGQQEKTQEVSPSMKTMMKNNFIKKIKDSDDNLAIFKAMRSFITSE